MITREELLGGRDYTIAWEVHPTTACNLRCTYCYNALKDHSFKRVPDPQYTIDELVHFLEEYAIQGDYLSFIGGEPFIRPDWVTRVMDATQRLGLGYSAYTNATLLKDLPPDFLNRFGNLNISIDGDEEQNDRVRGQGTFRRICDNLEKIRSDYQGRLVARMTVTPENDLVKSIENLLSLPFFDVIYWQYQNQCSLETFPTQRKWRELQTLLDFWVHHLKQGRVYPLHPFMVIVFKFLNLHRNRSYIKGEDYPPHFTLGCGAGYDYVQIFTTGELFACPELIMNSKAFMGTIRDGINKRVELPDFYNTSKCMICSEFEICHCRCLHFTPDEYCTLVKNTIRVLRSHMSLIERLITENILKENDFEINEDIEEMF